MTEMQPQGERRSHPHGSVRHESAELKARGIVLFALGLVALGVGIHFVLEQVMEHYARRESAIQASILPQLAAPLEIPQPHLQADPAAERIRIQQQQLEQLNGYGWVDRKAGIAHIPIERAMEILAQSGLPEIKEPQQTGELSPVRHEPGTADQRKRSFQVLPGRTP